MARAVIAIVRLVRPWYAWSSTSTASRPVARRAIFTAFSTASAPEFTSTERFSWSPGVSRASASHTATYSSYGLIMKQVCVKSRGLRAHRGGHLGRAGADRRHGDAGAEVDEHVAVDVLDDRTRRARAT